MRDSLLHLKLLVAALLAVAVAANTQNLDATSKGKSFLMSLFSKKDLYTLKILIFFAPHES